MEDNPQNGISGDPKADYYNSGSSELATETALTLNRLETVSQALVKPLQTNL